MNLTLTADQQDLRDTVAKFLADKAPVSAARALHGTESGFDPGVWHQLAEQLGLVGLTIPEQYGGLGAGPVELFLVLHEMGRVLYSGPYLSTVLAAAAITRTGDEHACENYLPAIAAGETIATLAFAEPGGGWSGPPATKAWPVHDGWVIDGTKALVLAVPAADLFIVTAATPNGPALFAVPSARTVVSTQVLDTLDLTRRLATVTFAAAPAEHLGSADLAAVDAILAYAYAATAAEQSGLMFACLDMSTEYARTREQFGVRIGSHQAVAHACAVMLGHAEHGRAAAHYAAAAHGTDEGALAARVALAYTAQAAPQVTTQTIQIHGGIGFTWEHDAHLYYRRARCAALLFGHPDHHLAAIADLAGL
jgi:alkylation response protein AidB-like acyl-CoA dehydrogenase